jgi:hypothetical protein
MTTAPSATHHDNAAPAQAGPGPADALPAEAKERLKNAGLAGDALDQFLRDLEDDPDDGVSASLGLAAAASEPSAEAARPDGEEKKIEKESNQAQLLSDDQITSIYGDLVASKAKEAGIDINAWRTAFDAGQDTSAYRQAMATAMGLPVELVAQYEAGGRPAKDDAPNQSRQLEDAEKQSLIDFAGGAQAFDALNNWVQRSIPDDPSVHGFNAAVASGNSEAAKAWLAAIALLHRQDVGYEPQLIQGGDAYGEASDTYQDYEELIADKGAIDQRTGRPRYEVDPNWRKYVDKKTRRSSALM